MRKEVNSEELYLSTGATDADISGAVEAEVVPTEEKARKCEKVSEILELRGENKKVFRMSDGTEQAEFYPNAVHLFDEETGEYIEPDNTLELEADGKHYRNKKGRFAAKFNREENSNELFSVEKGMHKVSVSAKKSKKRLGKTVSVSAKPKKGFNGKSVAALLDPIFDGISFGGMDDVSALEYTVTDDGVKENIIISEKASAYHYAFIIHCENVSAIFDELSKRVAFVSNETGEEVFFIPAPFMTDANGAASDNVSYEVKTLENGNVQLTITADSEWINAEERAFPVAIDPQIMVSGMTNFNTYSWTAGNMTNGAIHTVGTSDCKPNRMYMSFSIPALPRNPRIKKAELTFTQKAISDGCTNCPKFGLFRVAENIHTGTNTPAYYSDLVDYESFKQIPEGESSVSYTFDITSLIDVCYKENSSVLNIVLKLLDETKECNHNISIYGAVTGNYAPTIAITYESNYAITESYRSHTHDLGKRGKGIVDLACGNIMFEIDDFVWEGNRMPVTIRHIYNSALHDLQYTSNTLAKLNIADFSKMQYGVGWRLNLLESIRGTVSFCHENENYIGYVYTDANGVETYLKPMLDDDGVHRNMYEDVNGSDIQYDVLNAELKIGDTIYEFDDAFAGRLIKITDKNGNVITITYTSDKITSVSDGVGREFNFAYNSTNQLISIKAPDDRTISYTYSANRLEQITCSDGRKMAFAYNSDNYISTITIYDIIGGINKQVVYTYVNNRVASVSERSLIDASNIISGACSAFSYSIASRRTIVTTTEPAEDDTPAVTFQTVYVFDEDGNTVSEYMYTQDTGNIIVEGNSGGIHPFYGGSANVSDSSENLLLNHAFVNLENWNMMDVNIPNSTVIETSAVKSYSKFSEHSLKVNPTISCEGNGAYQTTDVLQAGEYTASAYVYMFPAFELNLYTKAYIRVIDTLGNILAQSEKISNLDNEFERISATFALASPQTVIVQLLVDDTGIAFFSNPQLEKESYASLYNMLEDGNFELNASNAWNMQYMNAEKTADISFNGNKCLALASSLDKYAFVSQEVSVKTPRAMRQSFTLSGWAKANTIVKRDRDNCYTSHFGIYAAIEYSNGEIETHQAEFSRCTDEWQFAAIEFAKEKHLEIEKIKVYCDYGYNEGTAYFDDIQLICTNVETDLSASDFLVESTEHSAEENDVVDTTTENHVTQSDVFAFEEAEDEYGNAMTETTFADGELGTFYRSFEFSENGNDLVKEVDTRGNTTEYTVDAETSRNEEIVDRLGNKTAYEYDDSGRTTKVTSKNANDEALANVSYGYDAFDNLKEIVRGDGMKYALAYDAFHNLESIGIEGKSEQLVKYDYKKGSGRLKSVTYANGNVMYATYNSIGQMIGEEWKDIADGNTIAKYKYSYDGNGNIVRSLDILAEIEYTYTYEQGRIVRATEARVSLNDNGFAVFKDIVNTIRYTYDGEGQLTKKTIVSANGETTVVHIDNANGNTIVKFHDGMNLVTSHSKSDALGRKQFDEIQYGTGFVSRQFAYLAGKVTEEHKENHKIKSLATTQLVSQIVLSDGMTLSYGYDAEERITSVVESYVVGEETVTNTILYTYDALGQLLTETVNGVVVNEMTYDNYGNILTKNGKAYTYGDPVWKDKLTSIDGQNITYDAQGNPVSYLGHALTWEKGRQLKSFDGISYTYNANGIRTSKTIGGIKHDFTLDGTKILREVWGDNTLVPMYDNEDSVCGIIYNSVPYYFLKNLQGDIISIVDKEACVVARYSYDAWGKVLSVTDNNGQLITDATHITHINPFRYRSYYFDSEIGLYYLQSRYYDPSIARFLNADDVKYIGVSSQPIFNLYSYCENNPVSSHDTTGAWSLKGVGDFFKKIFDVGEGICDFILGQFGISKRQFKKRNKYKNRNDLYNYVYNNKSKIKNLRNNFSSIGTFLGIILTVANAATIIRSHKSVALAIAKLLFEGLIKLIGFVAGKIIGWIVSKIAWFLFWLKFVIENVMNYIIDCFLSGSIVNRVRTNYLNAINPAKFEFVDFFVALFKGIKATI